MQDILSTITQNIADDEFLVSSYNRWYQSSLNKLYDYSSVVTNMLNGQDNYISGTSLQNLDGICQYGVDDAVRLPDLYQAIKTDQDVATIKGVTISIDQFIEDLTSRTKESDSFGAIIQILNDSKGNSQKALSMIAARATALTDNIGANSHSLQAISTILSDDTASLGQKLRNLLYYNGLDDATTPSADADTVVNQMKASKAVDMTGVNPFETFGTKVWDTIRNPELWSTVASAIVSPIVGAVKGVKYAIQWCKENGDKIATSIRNVAEAVSIQNADFTIKDDGEDNTIDNCMCLGQLPNWSDFLICLHDNDNPNYNYTEAQDFIKSFGPCDTRKFEIPGAIIYITHEPNSTFHYGPYYIGIKYKPLAVPDNSFDVGTSWGDFFINLDKYGSERISKKSIPVNYWSADEYFKDCCLWGKAVAHYFMYCVNNQLFNTTFNSTSALASIAIYTATGQVLNKALSGHTTGDHPDPTNADFASIMSEYYGQTDPIHTIENLGGGSNASKCFHSVIECACSLYTIADREQTFIPYTSCSKIAVGKYHIDADYENYNQFLFRAGITIAAVAAIALVATGIKIKTNLRKSAVSANLQASILQDQMKQTMISGGTPTPELVSNTYKATKKAVRLNNLTGGFASITTGLSTWQNGSFLGSGIDTNSTAERILQIIHG